jgi:hypothetical protein
MSDQEVELAALEPVPIKLDETSLAAIRSAAEFTPVFGVWQTLILQGLPADLQPIQILPQDYRRRKCYIQVNGTIAGPQQTSGSVTSPGANAIVASLGAGVPAGWYIAKWAVDLDGTVGAIDQNNFKLTAPNVNTGGTINISSENNPLVGHYPQDDVEIYVPTGNATVIAVKTVAAGTVGAIYSAQLTLIPVIPGNGFVLVGTLGQVSNGQGGRIMVGQKWEIKNHGALYLAGDGASAVSVVILVESDQAP